MENYKKGLFTIDDALQNTYEGFYLYDETFPYFTYETMLKIMKEANSKECQENGFYAIIRYDEKKDVFICCDTYNNNYDEEGLTKDILYNGKIYHVYTMDSISSWDKQ